MNARQPVLFLSHGSPMTAIEPDELGGVWEGLAANLARPSAIVMVSAHWITRLPMIGGAEQPETIHDFFGFPEALYRLRYPAPGAPELARRIKALLAAAGLASGIDAGHGLDHGAWVPLRTIFPAADVPVLQLSVQPDHCARHHYSLGQALAPLAAENVLIVASGHMTHNLADLFRDGGRLAPQTFAFRDWVHDRLIAGDSDSLLDWLDSAPHALLAHPTPEHFLPLFVALGAAGASHRTRWLGGGSVGKALAADSYLFESA